MMWIGALLASLLVPATIVEKRLLGDDYGSAISYKAGFERLETPFLPIPMDTFAKKPWSAMSAMEVEGYFPDDDYAGGILGSF
mgnify:CR=1 FL=1